MCPSSILYQNHVHYIGFCKMSVLVLKPLNIFFALATYFNQTCFGTTYKSMFEQENWAILRTNPYFGQMILLKSLFMKMDQRIFYLCQNTEDFRLSQYLYDTLYVWKLVPATSTILSGYGKRLSHTLNCCFLRMRTGFPPNSFVIIYCIVKFCNYVLFIVFSLCK